MKTLLYAVRHTKDSGGLKDEDFDGPSFKLTDEEYLVALDENIENKINEIFDDAMDYLIDFARNNNDYSKDTEYAVAVVIYGLQNGALGTRIASDTIAIVDQIDVGGELDIFGIPTEH